MNHNLSLSQPRDQSSPSALLRSIWTHRHLLRQITRRDISSRYRGSALGLLWSFITPLLMLAVYTFVFGIVFKARFGDAAAETPTDTASFAVTLFCGLILHGLLAECITRAPSIILHHTNYVKKVVFPLEILPVMVLTSSCFHFLMSAAVLIIGVLWSQGSIPITALYTPLVILPFLLTLLGTCWILASLGVYLRDIGQLTGLLSTLLLFLSPIFYPITALPEAFRPLMYLNPLTPIIGQLRDVLIHGIEPDLMLLGIYSLVGIITCCVGFAWFQKTRKGFADIL